MCRFKDHRHRLSRDNGTKGIHCSRAEFQNRLPHQTVRALTLDRGGWIVDLIDRGRPRAVGFVEEICGVDCAHDMQFRLEMARKIGRNAYYIFGAFGSVDADKNFFEHLIAIFLSDLKGRHRESCQSCAKICCAGRLPSSLPG